MENVYTMEEVSKIIKMPERTVKMHVDNGNIKFCKIGKHVRIMESHIEEFLKKYETIKEVAKVGDAI